MRYLLLLAFLSLAQFLVGCSTSAYWVKRNYEPKSGIVGFKSSGFLSEDRWEDAKKKMLDFCAPDVPKITSDEQHSETSGYVMNYNQFTNQTYVSNETSDHKRIFFVCTSKPIAK